MQKTYIAVGRWTDKPTKVQKTKFAEFNAGTNKAGNVYEIVKMENSFVADESTPFGTIRIFDMVEAKVQNGVTSTPTAKD